MSERQDFIKGLRDIADYYKANPSLPIPSTAEINVSATDSLEEAARLARLLAPCQKQHGSAVFVLSKRFAGVTLKFAFWRSAVCTRRVVGYKDVPEEVRPAHQQEIVEWNCEPILQDTETANP